jgi:hypothetical protein
MARQEMTAALSCDLHFMNQRVLKTSSAVKLITKRLWPAPEYFMKPATPSADNGTFSRQKSIFEFSLRARKITSLGALATQFHEISGLICRGETVDSGPNAVTASSISKPRFLCELPVLHLFYRGVN